MQGLNELSTEALLREVTVRFSEYRPDALEQARRLLSSRLDLLDQKPVPPLNEFEQRELEATRSGGAAEFGLMLLIAFATALGGTGATVIVKPYYADPITGVILLTLGLFLMHTAIRTIRDVRSERRRHEQLSDLKERSMTPDMSDPDIRDPILAWTRGDLPTEIYGRWVRTGIRRASGREAPSTGPFGADGRN